MLHKKEDKLTCNFTDNHTRSDTYSSVFCNCFSSRCVHPTNEYWLNILRIASSPGLTFFRKGPLCQNKFILLYMQALDL